MPDLRPNIAPALAVFGLPATVTLPGGQPVASTAIWLSPIPVETTGVILSTDRPQAVLALPRAAVPSMPRGTLITVAEMNGGPGLAWIVEAVENERPDEWRVVVKRS